MSCTITLRRMSSSRKVDVRSGVLGGFSCGSTSASVPSLDLHGMSLQHIWPALPISYKRRQKRGPCIVEQEKLLRQSYAWHLCCP